MNHTYFMRLHALFTHYRSQAILVNYEGWREVHAVCFPFPDSTIVSALIDQRGIHRFDIEFLDGSTVRVEPQTQPQAFTRIQVESLDEFLRNQRA
jgi:hypothetical protein